MNAEGTGHRAKNNRTIEQKNNRTLDKNELQVTVLNQNGKAKKRDYCPIGRTIPGN